MMTHYHRNLVLGSLFLLFSLDPGSLNAQITLSKEEGTRHQLDAKRALARRSHAKELLGQHFHRSAARHHSSASRLEKFIYQCSEKGLKKKWNKYSKAVAKSILNESDRYGFDPIFLMAVIENESSFDPVAVGKFGEIGLMQLTPETAKWIAKKYSLKWTGEKSLKDPSINIALGSAYLAYLRERFDNHSQLYLAAYNMGSRNVERALQKKKRPRQYSSRVMQRYIRFYTQLSQSFSKAVG